MSTTILPRTDESKQQTLKNYCELGWKIFPVWEIVDGKCACGNGECTKPGKHPNGLLAPHWDKDASSDWEVVSRWLESRPESNWGWALQDHFVLDVDPRNGFTLDDLDMWEMGFGYELPLTFIQDTGGGGRHHVFRDDGSHVGNGKVWSTGDSEKRKKIAGLDIKGVGGYIIIAPSVHESGGEYRWRTRPETAVSAPEGLRRMLKKETGSSPTVGEWDGSRGDREWTPDRVLRFFNGDVGIGDQNEEIMSFIGYQRMLGVAVDNIVASAWVAVERMPQDESRPWTFELLDEKIRGRCADLPAGKSTQTLKLSDATREWASKMGMGTKVESKVGGTEERPFILSFKQVMDRPPIQWLVNDVMPEHALFQLFGQTGQYKSFIVIDLLAQLANGQRGRFLGKEVTCDPGLTCMILGEGGTDIGERVRAWQESHPDMDMQNIYFIVEQGLNLLDMDDVNRLGRSLAELSSETGLPWRMIIFDTQADHIGDGDENDAKTFSQLKPVMQAFTQTFGACVGLVHHTGWDDTRERGSSRQRQMLDTVMESKDGYLYCRKQKAGAKFDPIPFRTVEVGGSLVVRGYEGDDLQAMHERHVQAKTRDTEAVIKYLRKTDLGDSDRTLSAIARGVGFRKEKVQEVLDALESQVTIVQGSRNKKMYHIVTLEDDLVRS